MATIKESRVREGLAKAALNPEGIPLQSNRNGGGLFPNSRDGREALETCLKSGWIESAPDSSGARLTPAGWDRLASDPRLDLVFSEFLRQVDAWKDQDRLLLLRAREHLSRLENLSEAIRSMARKGATPCSIPVESHLTVLSRPGVDVPLPALLDSIRNEFPAVSTGVFHDSLRELRALGRIHLHPWTGALHDIPVPEAALMAGHDIAYYASLREPGQIATESGA